MLRHCFRISTRRVLYALDEIIGYNYNTSLIILLPAKRQQPPEGTAAHPTIWLAIRFPGEDKTFRTGALAFTADGYVANVRRSFARSAGAALCNEIASQPLLITVFKDAPPPPIQIKPDAKAKAKGEKPREVEAPLPADFVCRLAMDLSDLLRGEKAVVDEARVFSIVNDSEDEKARVCLEPSVSIAVEAFEGAAPAGEGEAPARTPLALMSREEYDRRITLEMRVHDVMPAAPLPAELVAAMERAAGSLAFLAGFALPVGPSEAVPLLVPDGRLTGDKGALTFAQGSAKALLTEGQVAYMTSTIDQGTLAPLELCRQLKRGADFSDPAAPRYHVAGQLDLGPLVKPGTTRESYRVPLTLSLPNALAQGVVRGSCIPEAPHTEGPPVEEGEADPSTSALEGLGLTAEVEIILSRPLLPPWVAPEPPSVTLAEMIPPKTGAGLERGQASSADAFRDQCRKLAKEIAQEYLRMTGAGQPGADPSSHAERQKEMRFFLNRSGKFADVREALRESVVGVIRARMAVPGAGATAEDLGPLYNDVYMCLVGEVHRALDEVFRPQPAGEDAVRGPGPEKARALVRLAAECETMGAWPRAQQLLLDSLLGSKEAADHVNYGAFLCRKGDLGPAEEALREAVALDPARLDALSSLVALLVDLAAREDGLRLREAEVVAQAARMRAPESPLAWTLLAMVYAGMGPGKAIEAANSIYEARRVAREVHRADPSEGPLAAARLALDLQLPDAADAALRLLPATGSLPAAAQCEVEISTSRLLSLRGDVPGALDAAKRGALLVADPEDLRAHLLKAACYHRAGRVNESATQYQIAVQKAQAAGVVSVVPLVAFLRLGRALMELKDLQGALKAFLMGAQEQPCASAWLGAGRCLVALGDLDKADLALTEASTLDSQNPDVWGLMAAVALRQNRTAEAEQALKYALKFGFSDATVLREMGDRYFADGAFRLAEGVLKRALVAGEDPVIRLTLAGALLEQREAREAKLEVLRAIRAFEEAGTFTEAARARATALLKRAADQLGEGPAPSRAGTDGSGAAGKKPHERIMVFLGSETVH